MKAASRLTAEQWEQYAAYYDFSQRHARGVWIRYWAGEVSEAVLDRAETAGLEALHKSCSRYPLPGARNQHTAFHSYLKAAIRSHVVTEIRAEARAEIALRREHELGRISLRAERSVPREPFRSSGVAGLLEERLRPVVTDGARTGPGGRLLHVVDVGAGTCLGPQRAGAAFQARRVVKPSRHGAWREAAEAGRRAGGIAFVCGSCSGPGCHARELARMAAAALGWELALAPDRDALGRAQV